MPCYGGGLRALLTYGPSLCCVFLCVGGEAGKDGTTVPTLSRTISMPVDIAGETLMCSLVFKSLTLCWLKRGTYWTKLVPTLCCILFYKMVPTCDLYFYEMGLHDVIYRCINGPNI